MLFKGDKVEWVGENHYVGPKDDRRLAAQKGEVFEVVLYNKNTASYGIFLKNRFATFGAIDAKNIKVVERGEIYKLLHRQAV